MTVAPEHSRYGRFNDVSATCTVNSTVPTPVGTSLIEDDSCPAMKPGAPGARCEPTCPVVVLRQSTTVLVTAGSAVLGQV